MSAKLLFLVQGEGRGHLTQALALLQIVTQNNMQVCAIVVGSSDRRQVPSFFLDKMTSLQIPVIRLPSPNFATHHNRGINLWGTAWNSIKYSRKYNRSVELLEGLVQSYTPDLIINFYEPLTALYKLRHRKSPPVVAIAHQYLIEHPRFRFPKGRFLDRIIFKLYTRFTAFGSAHKMALSFYPLADKRISKLSIVPPLLRHEVKQLHTQKTGHFLVYLVNSGYIDDIIAWHKLNRDIRLHVFTDRKQDVEEEKIHHNFSLHRLNDVKFLKLMAESNGVISTAGFESICEALYLDKPVLMVPVEHHYEQYCNSRDGYRAGAGIYSKRYDIDQFINWLPRHISRSLEFREWSNKAEPLIIKCLTTVLETDRQKRFPNPSNLVVTQ